MGAAADKYNNKQEEKKLAKVYSTKIINEMIDDLNHGYDIDMDPFFTGDMDFRAPGILFEYTDEELEEWKRCQADPVYFISNYIKFENDNGVTLVQLRDYQKEFIHLAADEFYDPDLGEFVPDHRFLISMQSRQLGKTTTTGAVFVWYMLFHPERHLAIVANKGSTVNEIIRKMTKMIQHLPFWLKPGILKKNMSFIGFENGTFMQGFATSKTPSIGFTIHLLYIDEAALIPQNIMGAFWTAVFPTLSSSKVSKLIMTSTPRGKKNKFYEIWDKANKHENSFVTFLARWEQVYDEKWGEQMRKDFGDEEFEQEFNLSFDVQANKLVRSTDLRFMYRIAKDFQPVDMPVVPKEYSDKFRWLPGFDPNSVDRLGERYLISIDTAEGSEQLVDGHPQSDYNIANIFRIELMNPFQVKRFAADKHIKISDCFRFRQVGVYIDNTQDEEEMAKALKYLVYRVFHAGQGSVDNVRMLVEMNFNGKNFVNTFKAHDQYYEALIIKTFHRKPIPGQVQIKKPGFITTGGGEESTRSKAHFCETAARMITKRQIIISQIDKRENNRSSIEQLASFGKIKSKDGKRFKYEGVDLHDDIAMTVMNVPRAIDDEQVEFIDWLLDYFSQMKTTARKLIMALLLKQAIDDDPGKMSDETFNAIYKDGYGRQYEYAQPSMQGTPQNPYLNYQRPANPYLSMQAQRAQNPYIQRENKYPGFYNK